MLKWVAFLNVMYDQEYSYTIQPMGMLEPKILEIPIYDQKQKRAPLNRLYYFTHYYYDNWCTYNCHLNV